MQKRDVEAQQNELGNIQEQMQREKLNLKAREHKLKMLKIKSEEQLAQREKRLMEQKRATDYELQERERLLAARERDLMDFERRAQAKERKLKMIAESVSFLRSPSSGKLQTGLEKQKVNTLATSRPTQ